MHIVEVYETGKKLYIPENLSECDSRQYIEMAELILRYQTGLIDYEAMRIQSVYKLLNMIPVESKFQEDQDNKLSNIWQVSNLIDTFFDHENNTRTIKQDYIDNPVPFYRPVLKTYHGPFENLYNITFDEYRDGLRIFYQFNADKDINQLYVLAAMFYRPKKWLHRFRKHLPNYDGDIRQPYNSYQVNERAERFKAYPIGFVYGFYLYFASFQKYLTTARIPWNGNILDFSVIFESDGEVPETTHPGIGMDSLFFTMSESGVFGSADRLGKTKMFDVLVRMYDLRIKDIEHKKQNDVKR